MAFSKDFIFGAASAAYQIEGGWNEDGKGMSIWDACTQQKGHVAHNEDGKTACDSYHRYKEDVEILKKLNIKNYRFSISWTRIFPNGTGEINKKGIEYYSNLIDELLANGITPYVTIYHWDLPYELYKRGGWLNPDSSEWFLNYTKAVVDAFSDRVQNWFTINEPQVFIGMGMQLGLHAPFIKLSDRDLIVASRNVMLAHGKSAKYIRENAKTPAKIGFAPIGPVFTPKSDSKEDIQAAYEKTFKVPDKFDTMSLSWWSDPIVLGKFSKETYEKYGELMNIFSEDDFKIICQPLDFYATNIYYSQVDIENIGDYEDDAYIGSPRTTYDWPVTPQVLYWAPMFMYKRYKLPIIISENGMAGCDWIHLDGKVHDTYRIDFLHRYLNELERASEKVPVIGYFHWSLLDNYEWNMGYDKRFGIVYVDFRTGERTIKDSGFWLSDYFRSKLN